MISRSCARGAPFGLALLLLATSAHAEPAPLPTDRLSQAVHELMADEHIPGLTVAVRDKDGRRWSAGFGEADLESQVAAADRTSYRLASVSKTLTAVTVMRLAEAGKIDLDAEIQTYCPAFPRKPWPITSRELLAHTAGVRHYKDDVEYNSTKEYKTTVDALTVFENDALLQPPGTKFYYSTFGYVLLGCVVEGATGHDFMTALGEQVLKPAGMTHTALDSVHALVPWRAAGYVYENGALRNSDLADTSYKVPGGGLVATADDLVTFASALLDGTLLKPATVDAMWTSQPPGTGEDAQYGLGWELEQRHGLREVFHTGAQQRVSNALYMLPDEGRIVVVLSNLEDSESLALARRLADILAGRTSTDPWPPKPKQKSLRPWYLRVRS